MRKYAVFISLAFVCLGAVAVYSQSRRPSPSSQEGKANQRQPQPSPTPPTETVADTSVAPIADSDEIIKVDTRLVTIPVKILDRKNRFIPGLAKENFKVFEDGVEQEIALFSNEQQPFTVALVLDMSYSTKFKITEIQSAAIAFIDQLRNQDKVIVVSFDQEVHMLCEATTDRQKIYRAIKSTKIATGTSLYEAVDMVMNDRLRKIEGRKAIILFTDGVDTTSTKSHDLGNLRDAQELDALIYPIRYDTFGDVQAMKDKPVIMGPTIPSPPNSNKNPLPFPLPTIGTPESKGTSAEEYQKAEEYLNELSVRTGGSIYLADSIGNLANAFSKIANELREFYSLGYYPKDETADGKKRRLKVRVDREGAAVRARDGYIAGEKRKGKSK